MPVRRGWTMRRDVQIPFASPNVSEVHYAAYCLPSIPVSFRLLLWSQIHCSSEKKQGWSLFSLNLFRSITWASANKLIVNWPMSNFHTKQAKGEFFWDDPDQRIRRLRNPRWTRIHRCEFTLDKNSSVDEFSQYRNSSVDEATMDNQFIGSFDVPWSEWSWIIGPHPEHPKQTQPFWNLQSKAVQSIQMS